MKKKYIIPEIKAIAICHQGLMLTESELPDGINLVVNEEPEDEGNGD